MAGASVGPVGSLVTPRSPSPPGGALGQDMAAAIKYEQLQGTEIRLLKLEPEASGPEVRCSLRRQPLEAAAYNALSYAWGDPSCTGHIVCDGVTVEVTASLHQALLHVRRKHAGVLLWADAVCINQADTAEKTSQVRMMHSIYRRARLVVIWLGLEEPGDRDGYGLAHRIRQVVGDIVNNAAEVMATLNSSHQSTITKPALHSLVYEDSRWLGLYGLTTRGWFSRVWVMQELVSSQRSVMLSGHFEMDPYVLLNAAKMNMHLVVLNTWLLWIPGQVALYRQHRAASKLAEMVMLWRAADQDIPLRNALNTTQCSGCSDSRDRIFAVLLLARRSPPGLIDYDKERTAILLELASWLLGAVSHPIEVLGDAQSRDHLAGTPSWVPDYSAVAKPNPFNPVGNLFETDDSLDYGTASWSVEPDGALVMAGKVLDTIREIKAPIADALDLSQPTQHTNGVDFDTLLRVIVGYHAWIRDILRLCERSETYVTGISTEEAIWRSLIFDGAPLDTPAPREYEDVYRAWLRWIADGVEVLRAMRRCEAAGEEVPDELAQRKATLDLDLEGMAAFEKHIGPSTIGRRFCATQRGYVGFVPEDARVGDHVVSFSGAHVPFALRLKNGSGGGAGAPGRRWQLLGACYLHGLMHDAPMRMTDIAVEDLVIE